MDLHLHPQGHRLAPYRLEMLRDWAELAASLGFREIGLTDHDRLREGVRFDEVDRLRSEFTTLGIRLGIELDNDPETSGSGLKWVEQHWDQLDYVMGAVHFLADGWSFDRPGAEAEFSMRRIEKVWEDYFYQMRFLLATGMIDCIAHFDLVKLFGFVPRPLPLDLVSEILDELARGKIAIMIDTSGFRKPVGELYPSDWILREAVSRRVPLSCGSNSHSYTQIGEGYDRLAGVLGSMGIHDLVTFDQHQSMPLPTLYAPHTPL